MIDLPIDLPAVSPAIPMQPLNHQASPPTSAGNTPRETRSRSQTEGTGRAGRRQLLELADELTPRDWAILHSIAEHRFLTTRQLQMLHFAAHASPASASRSCRRVLERLRKVRVIGSLQRRIGGVRAGSAGYVWTTAAVGRRLLVTAADTPSRRHQEPSDRFLRHALAIADTHLALLEANRRGDLELVSVELEPACWRPYVAAGGQRAVLQPDLAITTGAGDYEDAWFIEVDLGSEHIPTLIRKCQQYETYRRTGIEQQRFGSFPWVLWLLSNERRVQAFQAALRHARSLDDELFRIATPAQLLDVITTTNQPKGGVNEP
jgi:hypothetical protein